MHEICQYIQQHGPISFAEFMHQALYAPHFGYYSVSLPKLGREGDFITAPELTPLFGQALAQQCYQILTHAKLSAIFEFGAGSGQLCVDILSRLESLDSLPEHYYILEVSAYLKMRQQALIERKIPHLAKRVMWLSRWPEVSFAGIVIANEVLDAMPVHRFLRTNDQIFESYVTLDPQADGNLKEIFQPCGNSRLEEYVQRVLPHTCYPYQSEANLYLDAWFEQCYAMLESGVMLILDYGFPRHEYYHPERVSGTLMCHYKHRAHPNPLIHVGEQDITAHVDFTHVAEAAHAAGFHVAGYTHQASFLIGNGLLDLFSAQMANDSLEQSSIIRTQQAVKQLIQPSEMGELFKAIALTKKLDLSLSGFQWYDKRASL